jgi:hypothetical protein
MSAGPPQLAASLAIVWQSLADVRFTPRKRPYSGHRWMSPFTQCSTLGSVGAPQRALARPRRFLWSDSATVETSPP